MSRQDSHNVKPQKSRPKAGSRTGALGKRLYEKYEQYKKSAGSPYDVYYDHGTNPKNELHCRVPEPFFGERPRASTLSNLDIAVVKKGGNDVQKDRGTVELAVEIEETEPEPKTFIGDIVNLILADHVRIDKKDYDVRKWVLVLGVMAKEIGHKRQKFEAICEKLVEMNQELGKRELVIHRVYHSNPDQLVAEVEAKINELLSAEKPS